MFPSTALPNIIQHYPLIRRNASYIYEDFVNKIKETN
jgi:hypothetical protein